MDQDLVYLQAILFFQRDLDDGGRCGRKTRLRERNGLGLRFLYALHALRCAMRLAGIGKYATV
ncbi:MAG: hypothetical protein RR482_09035, partial [Clostridia bacterium]